MKFLASTMKILASTIVHQQDFQSRYWWWSLQVNSVLEVLSEHQTRLSCDSYESDIGKVWDAGLVLIEYLTLHSDLIAKPKKVIEPVKKEEDTMTGWFKSFVASKPPPPPPSTLTELIKRNMKDGGAVSPGKEGSALSTIEFASQV